MESLVKCTMYPNSLPQCCGLKANNLVRSLLEAKHRIYILYQGLTPIMRMGSSSKNARLRRLLRRRCVYRIEGRVHRQLWCFG